MARLVNDPAQDLQNYLGAKARVLLINPPVQEKRYHWIEWNQPMDLLRLSSWVKRSSRSADVRLFDFMFPDPSGGVPKHKTKDLLDGMTREQPWHFGQSFTQFDDYFGGLLQNGWVPDLILVSSLTSYWHISIEKLLVRVCNLLGERYRSHTRIALYGAYPCIEREHAETQADADVAFSKTIDLIGYPPDFDLYVHQWKRPPNFYALDIEDPNVVDQMSGCLEITDKWSKLQRFKAPAFIPITFFNSDLCGAQSQIERIARVADRFKGRIRMQGICGLHPSSLSYERLQAMLEIGFRSLFVEYAINSDGSLNEEAYKPLRELVDSSLKPKKDREEAILPNRDGVTAFINVGLPNDNLEAIVRNTLLLNSYFQAIIIKPFGYSPDIDSASVSERRARWPMPAHSSPQWFPYAGHGSALDAADYDNLMRWQSVLNKRVKGLTFDFLDTSSVPRLVRETLIEETWKRRP